MMMISAGSLALPNAVLSNFNQPSSGSYDPVSSLELIAVPFTTDSQFLQLDGVEINAATLLPPGNLFVQIWDTDVFGQPGASVGDLSGPTDTTGLTQYTGSILLQAETSYFLVIGAANGAGTLGTAVFAIDGNTVDSQPSPVYQIGTDLDGNGSIDLVNKCLGKLGSTGWRCAGPTAQKFFPEFRLLAEELAPPVTLSLTSSPLALDFGVVPQGGTSAPLLAVIENDGTGPQTLGSITVGAGFNLVVDGCSGMVLAPGATCSIEVTFSPPHGGTTTGTAVIPAAGDPRSPYGLVLTGTSAQSGTPLPTVDAPVAVPLKVAFATAILLLITAATGFRRRRQAGR